MLDPAELERTLTPRSRLLVLNTPHNPTGKVFTRDELESIAAVVRRHPRLLVLSDEVYEFAVFDSRLKSTVALRQCVLSKSRQAV